jgi:glycosyltransferase involved in cell wall biosynthesis
MINGDIIEPSRFGKLKIGIYAACKNELKHVQAWYDSFSQGPDAADYIVVADTGSTDGSLEYLKQLRGVAVTSCSVIPWRFDLAFNIAMSLLPADTDICIRLDLDERLQPGWRKALEQAWTPGTTRLRYPYVWDWQADGQPGRTWMSDRIHSRNGYMWHGATHEGLCARYGFYEHQSWTQDVKIWQYPDAKEKSGDLPLLLEAVSENPTDSRMMAYLGRQYMYQGDNVNATKTYGVFLGMSYDKIERAQAMLNLSKTDPTNKIMWLKMAAIETPTHREPLVELSQHYHNEANWVECLKYANLALAITEHPMDYTCGPEAWGSQPWDLASIALWNIGMPYESHTYASKAAELNPTDSRLQNNLRLIEEHIKLNLA